MMRAEESTQPAIECSKCVACLNTDWFILIHFRFHSPTYIRWSLHYITLHYEEIFDVKCSIHGKFDVSAIFHVVAYIRSFIGYFFSEVFPVAKSSGVDFIVIS